MIIYCSNWTYVHHTFRLWFPLNFPSSPGGLRGPMSSSAMPASYPSPQLPEWNPQTLINMDARLYQNRIHKISQYCNQLISMPRPWICMCKILRTISSLTRLHLLTEIPSSQLKTKTPARQYQTLKPLENRNFPVIRTLKACNEILNLYFDSSTYSKVLQVIADHWSVTQYINQARG